ncbi:MAG: histidinol dehydrogenase, partial [Erythrobacter sp.]|nr:histidinol dehydrogenase [Erythrobacter sp.]
MKTLSTLDPDFQTRFTRLVNSRREADGSVAGQVSSILADVKGTGDKALIELTQRFDGYSLIDEADWVVTKERMKEAYDALEPELRDALETAANRIRAYHEAHLPAHRDYTDDTGVRLG